MKPDDLSVLVRKLDTILEIRLISTIPMITFELFNNLREPQEAILKHDNITYYVPVINNFDGSFSILIYSMAKCEIILELF